ncbi:MAG: SUMF1/EgtB/PvdO family nonheme iron enzyme [Spirochaetaceae bacterium]|jgi:formylglycine-generating enzyme required for sulfatase activity|nr:SUMF1/EgtB/PvdO family nonheme iron enzyme [Spirochaetaceae bacterium]
MDKKPDEQDAVKLPPLLGMRPGCYLTLFYGAVIVIVIFSIFLFPGIARKGSIYRFTSEPAGAAIRVDDVYYGYTPCEFVVPAGKRLVSAALPGFEQVDTEESVKARLFVRRPFARAVKRHIMLREEAPFAALVSGANDYAEWSFIGEPSAVYQQPHSLSTGMMRSAAALRDFNAEKSQKAEEILISSFRFTTTNFAMADFVRALVYLESGGAAPSPAALASAIDRAARALERDPLLSVVPASILPQDMAALILNSPLYPREAIDFSAENRIVDSRRALFGETITIGAEGKYGGLKFTAVEGGEFVKAANFPHTEVIEPFYIAINEITTAGWAAFTDARPEWRLENAAELVRQGLAGEGYLQTSPAMRASSAAESAAAISAFAAEAYCEYLTGKLPPSLSDYEVRLPTEAEWEYAAKAAAALAPEAPGGAWNPRLPQNMLPLTSIPGPANAGLWEWCADDFAPQNFFSVKKDAALAVRSPERNIRGGCWVNQPYAITAETRASLPPLLCSTFVSARPVIARKR